MLLAITKNGVEMGLSLKNETVINALKDKGYSIEKLISQEETLTEKEIYLLQKLAGVKNPKK